MVRKVDVATGVVTTLSTGVYLYGVCTDGTNLYGASPSWHCIYSIPVTGGTKTVFAGSEGTAGNQDGSPASARFNAPFAICIDAAKANLYVTDSNNGSIRKIIIASGVVSTLATGLQNPESICLFGTTLGVNTTNGTALVDTTSGAVSTPTVANGQTVYGFHAYDGTDFLYRANGDSIVKTQTSTSPWGTLWAKSTTNKGMYAACFCGSDLYLTDSGTYGIYKLVSIK